MTTLQGSCQCGAIRFELRAEKPIEMLYECNCSRCRRTGILMWFGPRTELTVTAGEGATTTYQFHKKVIDHHFCPTCGVSPFSFGETPEQGKTAAVNVRCLEGFDFYGLPTQRFDGAAF